MAPNAVKFERQVKCICKSNKKLKVFLIEVLFRRGKAGKERKKIVKLFNLMQTCIPRPNENNC